MTVETIVAIYDTAAQADAAVRDLKAANVPADAISQHAGTSSVAPRRLRRHVNRGSGPACSAANPTPTPRFTTAACRAALPSSQSR